MQRLADIAAFSTVRRRFVPLAEPCMVCEQPTLTNEMLAVEIGGSDVSVFACGWHPHLEVIDQIVWLIVNALQTGRER
jgi:hypothetical protein